ncbi:MAG: Spy/CpxP family protein refolding chaperone [bacterium]
MSWRRPLLALVAAVLVLAIPAAGQGPHRDPRAERIIEALMIWRLVDEVNLTEFQIGRIFPRIKALKEIRFEIARRRAQIRNELNALLVQSPRNDDLIRAKIDELDQFRRDIEVRRQRILQEIYNVLTISQRAKFALIQETFEAETLRLLEEVRRMVEEQQRRQ